MSRAEEQATMWTNAAAALRAEADLPKNNTIGARSYWRPETNDANAAMFQRLADKIAEKDTTRGRPLTDRERLQNLVLGLNEIEIAALAATGAPWLSNPRSFGGTNEQEARGRGPSE